jgi:hypothetical protein
MRSTWNFASALATRYIVIVETRFCRIGFWTFLPRLEWGFWGDSHIFIHIFYPFWAPQTYSFNLKFCECPRDTLCWDRWEQISPNRFLNHFSPARVGILGGFPYFYTHLYLFLSHSNTFARKAKGIQVSATRWSLILDKKNDARVLF